MKTFLQNRQCSPVNFTVLAVLLASMSMVSTSVNLVSMAYSADEAADIGQKGAGTKQGGTKGQDAGSGGGKKGISKVLEEGDDDSDRPDWAGGNTSENPHSGGGGGKPDDAGTMKGDDYGDLWVLLRDDSGAPILDENEQVQPILLIDGEVVIGELVDPDGDGRYELPAEDVPYTQEVELGRSNVSRSDERVILHSLEEALSKLDGLTLTDEMLDAGGRLIIDGSTIDSPLENLALYQALLLAPVVDGYVQLSIDYQGETGSGTYTFLVSESDQLDLAASLLAAGSDKTAALTVDRVVNVSEFLGVADALGDLVTGYTYDGTTLTYNSEVWINVQIAGMDTPLDLSDDVYQSVAVNLVNGTTIILNDGSQLDVPGVSFETVPNTVDENGDNELTAADAGDLDGIDGFTQAADDALQVIEYVHDSGI